MKVILSLTLPLCHPWCDFLQMNIFRKIIHVCESRLYNASGLNPKSWCLEKTHNVIVMVIHLTPMNESMGQKWWLIVSLKLSVFKHLSYAYRSNSKDNSVNSLTPYKQHCDQGWCFWSVHFWVTNTIHLCCYRDIGFPSKNLHLCSSEQKGIYLDTWGWVNGRVNILGWRIPFLR